MKKLLIFSFAALILASCSKEFEAKNVTYIFEQGPKKGVIAFLDENDSLITEEFQFDAANTKKRWVKTIETHQGEPVYMYLRYKKYIPGVQNDGDVHEFPMMTFRASILVDGKTYMFRDRIAANDTIRVQGQLYYFLKMHGTIPF